MIALHLLHIASANGNLEIVKLLLRARASVNKELRGATPLSIATYNRHAAVVKCLLQAGANPEIPYRGCTPLLIAELKEYHEIVKLCMLHNLLEERSFMPILRRR